MTPEPNTDRCPEHGRFCSGVFCCCADRHVRPEPNTDRARQAIRAGIDRFRITYDPTNLSDPTMEDRIFTALSDAGLWVGEPGDVPPWMEQPTIKDGTLGAFWHDRPLYVVRPSPPEENER